MFNKDRYENSKIEGAGTLEISGNENAIFAPLIRTDLRGTISGPLATFEIEQLFRVPRDGTDPIEAIYRFPLPGDAAIRRVTVRFGDSEIATELKPRVEAEKEYRQAVDEGRQGMLMTKMAPDVFALMVAGIMPGQDVTVNTSIVQMGSPEGPGFSFQMPLTTAPRYTRWDERLKKRAASRPLAMWRDPGHRFTMRVRSEGGGSLSSRSFELTEREGTYSLKKGEVIPDRDLDLHWFPEQRRDRQSVRVFTEGGKNPCFLLLVTPSMGALVKKPCEVILLVDHSGSMGGSKWEAADWAVEKALRSLGPDDRFNLCLFHSVTKWFAPKPVEAKRTCVDKAVMFLRDRSSGGTELGMALEQALMQESTVGDMARQVLIITDAQVTDDERIISLVRRERIERGGRRCNVLCIDASPNARLARQIAKAGGGSCRFLTSSAEEEDITTAMDGILSEWNSPMAEGFSLHPSRPVTIIGEATCADSYYLDEVRYGRSYWLAGRCIDGKGPLRFFDEKTAAVVSGKPAKGVEALYGALLMDELEMLRGIGASREHVVKQLSYLDIPVEGLTRESEYPENEQARMENEMARLVESVSLKYGVIGSETAFVATCSEKGHRVASSTVVGNALPAGWSGIFQSPPSSFMMANVSANVNCRSVHSLSVQFDRDDLLSLAMEAFCDASHQDIVQNDARSSIVCEPRNYHAADGTGEVTLEEVAAESMICDVESVRIIRMEVIVPCSTEYNGDAEIQIFIGDVSRPVARSLLRDVISMEGRPLNLIRTIGQPMRIVLTDPSGSARDLDYKVILVTAPA